MNTKLAIPLLVLLMPACTSTVISGADGNGGGSAGGGGQRSFAWRFDQRPQPPTGNSNDFTIDPSALYLVIGDVDRTCADPYILTTNTTCTPGACAPAPGWQLMFSLPPSAEQPGTVSAGSPDLHMELDTATAPTATSSASDVNLQPYASGAIQVVSVSDSEVVVSFSGLVPSSWAVTMGADNQLDGHTFHVPRNCPPGP